MVQASEGRYTPNGDRIEERAFDGFGAGEVTRDNAIPAGPHKAYLGKITQINTQYGWTNKLWWEVQHGDETVVVTELAPISTSINARFMRRLAAINGRIQFDKGVNLADVPTTGYAIVETEVENGFNKVVDVAPIYDDVPF